jgi:hypothetical protein
MPRDTDVLFVGSSFLYCDVSPMEIYDERGVTSFVLGGPEQSMGSSYALLRSALNDVSPELVVLELKGLSFLDDRNIETSAGSVEAANNSLLSPYFKLLAAFSGRKIDGGSPFYDFFTYHHRWSEIGLADITESAALIFGGREADMWRGYIYLTDAGDVEFTDDFTSPLDEAVFGTNAEYLKLITELCEAKGIKLMFLATPNVSRNYYNNYIDYARAKYPNIPLMAMNSVAEDIGIAEADYYDGGHMNISGAKKVSRYLADKLAEEYALDDHRGESGYEYWDEDLKSYLQFIENEE